MIIWAKLDFLPLLSWKRLFTLDSGVWKNRDAITLYSPSLQNICYEQYVYDNIAGALSPRLKINAQLEVILSTKQWIIKYSISIWFPGGYFLNLKLEQLDHRNHELDPKRDYGRQRVRRKFGSLTVAGGDQRKVDTRGWMGKRSTSNNR